MRALLWALLLAVALRSADSRKNKRKGPVAPTAQHSKGAQLLVERRLPEALESFDRAVAQGDPVHRETRARPTQKKHVFARRSTRTHTSASCWSRCATKQDTRADGAVRGGSH